MAKVKKIRLKEQDCLTDPEANSLAAKELEDSSFRILVQEDTDVIKPGGGILLKYRKDVLPETACKKARPALRKAANISYNRGYAAGEVELEGDKFSNIKQGEFISDGSRYWPIKPDGTLSNTSYAKGVESGVIGFYDKYPRIPYCRLTAFNLHHPEKFQAALPMIKAIDEVFKSEMPKRYSNQLELVRRTSSDFVISETSFTTITINRNWRTRVHKDEGDLREGFGVMSALTTGGKGYKGMYLCFPKYKVAVDMRTRGVCLADVHEWHGNTPFYGTWGAFERISLVCYYREGMKDCGSAERERERADQHSMENIKRRSSTGVDKQIPSFEGL